MKNLYLIVKRILDIILSLLIIIAGIFFWPLFLIIIISIKIESKGPVFFKQERTGYNSKPFYLYKFRSYSINHDCFCQDEDCDLTKVGKILRKFSIDEIPQVINVLKGDMSFIGPRPWMVENLQYYTEEQKRRLDVLPGITGYAQVNGRKNLDMMKRIEYDIYYVDNMSFKLDLEIFFKTISLILIKREGNRIVEKTPKAELEELKTNFLKVKNEPKNKQTK